jgi:cyclopropane-fatty-acyl-phospholipid synthase
MWLFERFLTRLIRKGQLTLIYHDGRTLHFGAAHPDFPDLTLRLTDARVARDIVFHPRLGFTEAYMDGRAIVEGGDIMAFIKLVRGNNRWEDKRSIEGASPVKRIARGLTRNAGRANARLRARRNVAHHYDLSASLYDLFLDRDRQYSCAYWPEETRIDALPIDLDQSQADKKAHIAAKLALKPGMKVLDIGCGWGGMALYLHRNCGVDVLGVTLSEEQLKIARARAEAAGVSEHVRFALIDYRDVQGPFDRIVSVGMFEHVGVPHFRRFFAKCHDLLTEDGVMLLHTIGRMGGPGSTDAFTDKYIFPGGYIPALSEIVTASEPARLMVTDVESLRLHYAFTLREWYKRTVARRAEIEALYDERFFRMWTLYLAGATSAFEDGGMLNYQIQYARSRHSLPITRDYMARAEAEIRAQGAG